MHEGEKGKKDIECRGEEWSIGRSSAADLFSSSLLLHNFPLTLPSLYRKFASTWIIPIIFSLN
jgi:hypothetical protein